MRPVTSLVESKEEVARLGGFEPPTSGSGDQRSIQLSYRRAVCGRDALPGRIE